MKRGKYIVYVASENVDDDRVHPCENYAQAVNVAFSYVFDDFHFYEWSDETLREMIQEITGGMVDMRNGRALNIIEWDGTSDPVEVARTHEKSLNEPDPAEFERLDRPYDKGEEEEYLRDHPDYKPPHERYRGDH